jgi:integrase
VDEGPQGCHPDFRVPLTAAALRVIEEGWPSAREGFLFPNVRKGVISDATMSRLMERRGLHERPHGFGRAFEIGSPRRQTHPMRSPRRSWGMSWAEQSSEHTVEPISWISAGR